MNDNDDLEGDPSVPLIARLARPHVEGDETMKQLNVRVPDDVVMKAKRLALEMEMAVQKVVAVAIERTFEQVVSGTWWIGTGPWRGWGLYLENGNWVLRSDGGLSVTWEDIVQFKAWREWDGNLPGRRQ